MRQYIGLAVSSVALGFSLFSLGHACGVASVLEPAHLDAKREMEKWHELNSKALGRLWPDGGQQ